MTDPTQIVRPGHDMPPTWRAACLAYRAAHREGASDNTAWEAARAAVLQEFPSMSVRVAGEQASDSLAYALVHHRAWLWPRLATRPDPDVSSYPVRQL